MPVPLVALLLLGGVALAASSKSSAKGGRLSATPARRYGLGGELVQPPPDDQQLRQWHALAKVTAASSKGGEQHAPIEGGSLSDYVGYTLLHLQRGDIDGAEARDRYAEAAWIALAWGLEVTPERGELRGQSFADVAKQAISDLVALDAAPMSSPAGAGARERAWLLWLRWFQLYRVPACKSAVVVYGTRKVSMNYIASNTDGAGGGCEHRRDNARAWLLEAWNKWQQAHGRERFDPFARAMEGLGLNVDPGLFYQKLFVVVSAELAGVDDTALEDLIERWSQVLIRVANNHRNQWAIEVPGEPGKVGMPTPGGFVDL